MTYATLQIINTVCKVLDTPFDQIQSMRNSRMDARMALAMILLENGVPNNDVALVLRRHHSTVIHYRKEAEESMRRRPYFALNVNECRRRIREML